MPLSMIVCVKQVMDPETPSSVFKIDSETKRVEQIPGMPPVLNGFDENAIEAALRIKDIEGGTITILSVGHNFVMDVMKKPLSMGADTLVLVDDPALSDLDASATAYVLCEAVKKIGRPDLIMCGRQASDWDNAHVPLGISELLDVPCISVVQKAEVRNGYVVAERVIPNGYEIVEADLPSVVTITNELGQPRYPTLRGIMGASRKTPTVWTAAELVLEDSKLAPKVLITDLCVSLTERQIEFIEGDNDSDSGRKLALRLREDKLF